MPLSSGQKHAQRMAEAIDCEMAGAPESTTTAPWRLLPMFFGAPAAHAWARTLVASIIPGSVSGSVANAASMRSHTLATHQRTKRLDTLFQAPYSRLKQPPLCAAPADPFHRALESGGTMVHLGLERPATPGASMRASCSSLRRSVGYRSSSSSCWSWPNVNRT